MMGVEYDLTPTNAYQGNGFFEENVIVAAVAIALSMCMRAHHRHDVVFGGRDNHNGGSSWGPFVEGEETYT